MSGSTQQTRRVILASLIGTSLEWYDFFLYTTAATLVFPKLFFPSLDPFNAVLVSLTTNAVAFVARPLGGIVFGHFGDKYGRKKLLQLAIILVGVSTFLMGFLPTFDQIGYAAPILLIVLRFIDGNLVACARLPSEIPDRIATRNNEIFVLFPGGQVSKLVSPVGLTSSALNPVTTPAVADGGLAIAKRVVEAHKGTIRVRSREGNGTRFEIGLPPSVAITA